jgi:hypothetical protein
LCPLLIEIRRHLLQLAQNEVQQMAPLFEQKLQARNSSAAGR